MKFRTSGMSPLMNRQELNELQRMETQWNKGFGRNGTDPTDRFWPTIVLNNTLGADIAPGEHVSIDPTLAWDIAWGESLDYVPDAIEPDAEKAPAVALNYVRSGELGPFVLLGVAIAEVAGGTGTFAEVAASRVLQPTESATAVRLLGTPHASQQRLLPVLLGATGGAGAILAQSPSGGIPAGSAGTTRPTTFGSATCDLIDPATGDVYTPNQTETIHNLVDLVIPESVIFKAEKVGDRYIVDVASCTPPTDGPVFPTP